MTDWTRLQIRTLIICFLLSMLDGADVLVVSFVAPVLTQIWDISDAAFGLVFSSGLAGMTLGALLLAPFADTWGRKAMILIATTVIASGMIGSAWTSSVYQLVALRFWTGLGIGSMLASITALASEYAPVRSKAFAVTFVTAGYPAGATAAGLAASSIIPAFGWEGMFIIIGLGSAVMFPMVLFILPESVEFLAARQPRGALDRINRNLSAEGKPPLQALPDAPQRAKRPPIGRLLATDMRRDTLLLWGAFFASFFTVYFLTSWVPRVAVGAGYPLATAINGSAVFNIGAFLGLILLGWFAARLELARLIAAFFLLAAVVMLAFGWQHRPEIFFYAGMISIGFLVQGGFGGLYAIATRLYPAAVKATGVGWAIGIGRLGAVAGPAVGGLAISNNLSLLLTFGLFALPMVVAALLILAVSPERDRGNSNTV